MFNKMIIYKDNLINNIKQVKQENPNSRVCAMVKANAYGVGDTDVVQVLEEFVDFWGVACFFEAERIKSLTQKPILIFGSLEKEFIDERYSYMCGNLEDLNYLISTKKRIKVHLKVNSGMNRYGFKSLKDFKKGLNLIAKSSLVLEGVFSHFATCDEYVDHQMKIFNKYKRVVLNYGFKPLFHVDKSFVNEKFNHNEDMVRVGFNLYDRSNNWFLPAIEIKTEIVEVQNVKKGELVGYNYRFVAEKNMKIAVLPIGYADGFDLKLIGFNLNVLGRTCKVLNICMDCLMIDISDSELKKGDEIYLLNKFNSLKKYAEYLGTTDYEVGVKFSHIRASRIII